MFEIDTDRDAQWKGDRLIMMALLVAASLLAIALLATIAFRS